jgi:hypothetical protein
VPGQVFLPNWHIEAITYQLERVRRGETRRLIITLPPRNLKSICDSVAFPAFVLGHDPSVRIVCARSVPKVGRPKTPAIPEYCRLA